MTLIRVFEWYMRTGTRQHYRKLTYVNKDDISKISENMYPGYACHSIITTKSGYEIECYETLDQILDQLDAITSLEAMSYDGERVVDGTKEDDCGSVDSDQSDCGSSEEAQLLLLSGAGI